MSWLKDVKSFDAETTIDGPHSTASGKNDALFLEQLKTLLQNSGEMMKEEHCQGPFDMGVNRYKETTIKVSSIAAAGEKDDDNKFLGGN